MLSDAAGKRPFVVSGKEVGSKDGEEIGEIRSYSNCHFLRVYEGGHMVPMYQPEAALGMLNALLERPLGQPAPSTEVVVV